MLIGRFRFVDLMFGLLLVQYSSNMEVSGVIVRGNWIKRQNANYFISTNKGSWEDAKKSCSGLNSRLLEINSHGDTAVLKNNVTFLGEKFWIGLRKNDSNISLVEETEDDILTIDNECLTAKQNKSFIWKFKTSPCNWVRTFFCRKRADSVSGCGEGWTKYEGSDCILPVYHRVNWYGAYVHCKKLNGHLLSRGNLTKPFDSFFRMDRYFWVAKRYRYIVKPDANWTWYKDNIIFSNWSNWEITMKTVGCSGCGFWNKGRILLNADCDMNHLAICRYEILQNTGNVNSMGRSTSWMRAKSICGQELQSSLPQLTDKNVEKIVRNASNSIHNLTFWLGLQKNYLPKEGCAPIKIENDAKFTDFTLHRCFSVNCLNVTEKVMQTPCAELQHPLCIKPKKHQLDTCTEPWHDCKNLCCLASDNVQTSWIAAYVFCRQQGGRLAEVEELTINEFQPKIAKKRCWLSPRLAYSSRDPLEGWYWLNGTPLNVNSPLGIAELRYNGKKRKCAAVVHHRTWEDEPCENIYTFICKTEKPSAKINKKVNNVKDRIYNETIELYTKIITDTQFKYGNVSEKPKDGKTVEEILPVFTKLVVRLVNQSSFNMSFNIKKDGSELDIFTTTLDELLLLEKNATQQIPIASIGKLCENRQPCTVKGITMKLDQISLNKTAMGQISDSAIADIISLNYLAEGKEVKKLYGNETISLQFETKDEKTVHKVHCIFLDGNVWSKGGLESDLIDDKTVKCITNHLTSFSMVVLDSQVGTDFANNIRPARIEVQIMYPSNENRIEKGTSCSGFFIVLTYFNSFRSKKMEPSEEDAQILSYINYIGSGLSLAALLFTLLFYIIFHSDIRVLSSSRHLVHLNLLFALGATQIAFFAGGERKKEEISCKIVAILLHYFSLASFCWMLVEAVMLYLKLISVFRGEFVQMKKFCAFGWGFPLIFVIICAVAQIDSYGTDKWCWLSYDTGYFWVFFAPIIIILTLNLLTFIAVVRVIYRVGSSCADHDKRSIYFAVRGAVILLPALGLSWIFGVIAVNHDSILWEYLFVIFNSMQGFLIFLIYGVCNGEIKAAIKRRLGREVAPSKTR